MVQVCTHDLCSLSDHLWRFYSAAHFDFTLSYTLYLTEDTRLISAVLLLALQNTTEKCNQIQCKTLYQCALEIQYSFLGQRRVSLSATKENKWIFTDLWVLTQCFFFSMSRLAHVGKFSCHDMFEFLSLMQLPFSAPCRCFYLDFRCAANTHTQISPALSPHTMHLVCISFPCKFLTTPAEVAWLGVICYNVMYRIYRPTL